MSKRYKVTAEYVTVTTKDLAGSRVLLGFYRNAILPDDITDEAIKHHLSTGQIEAVEIGSDGTVSEPDDAEDLRQTAPEQVTDGLGDPNLMPAKEGADGNDGADGGPQDMPEPKRSDKRELWVEYAVSKGADRDDIEDKNPSRDDLIATWGTPRS